SHEETTLNNTSASSGQSGTAEANAAFDKEQTSLHKSNGTEQNLSSKISTKIKSNTSGLSKSGRTHVATNKVRNAQRNAVTSKRPSAPQQLAPSQVDKDSVVNDNIGGGNTTITSAQPITKSALTDTELTKNEIPALNVIDSLSENPIAEAAAIQKLPKRKISWSLEASVGFGNRHEQVLKDR